MSLKDYLFYKDDWAKIYCGDCLEVMPLIEEKIDMILCDLPYGTTACLWDTIIPFEPLWKEYKRLIKNNKAIVLFGSEPFSSYLRMSNLKWFKYDWIWDKITAKGHLVAKYRPLQQTENISIFGAGRIFYNPIMNTRPQKKIQNRILRECKRTEIMGGKKSKLEPKIYDNWYPKNIISIANDRPQNLLHPTQKPITLFEYLIKTYTNEEDLILDNCLGSGTTLLASKNLNRKSIGIEINPKYCEIAVKRLRQEVFDFRKGKPNGGLKEDRCQV